MSKQFTREGKTAQQITKLLSDVQLDLDRLGEEFARSQSTLFVNRLVIVAESAYETKKGIASHVGLHQN